MSINATLKQGAHTLRILDEMEVEKKEMVDLHNGYLADLITAMQRGLLPTRGDLSARLGLYGKVTFGLSLEEMLKAANCEPVDTELIRLSYLPQIKAPVIVEWALDPGDRIPTGVDLARTKIGSWLYAGLEHLMAFVATSNCQEKLRCVMAPGLLMRDSQDQMFFPSVGLSVYRRPVLGSSALQYWRESSCLMYREVVA